MTSCGPRCENLLRNDEINQLESNISNKMISNILNKSLHKSPNNTNQDIQVIEKIIRNLKEMEKINTSEKFFLSSSEVQKLNKDTLNITKLIARYLERQKRLNTQALT